MAIVSMVGKSKQTGANQMTDLRICDECNTIDISDGTGTEVEGEMLCGDCLNDCCVYVQVPGDCGENDFWAWK